MQIPSGLINWLSNLFKDEDEKTQPAMPQVTPPVMQLQEMVEDKNIAPAEAEQTLTPPKVDGDSISEVVEESTSLHTTAQKSLIQPPAPTKEECREALLKRFGCITATFEAEPKDGERIASDPTIDTPQRKHAERFYVCTRDEKDGLTIGYGTFFTKQGALIKKDEELLDLIEFTPKKATNDSEIVNLSKDEKRALIKNLLKNMGTRTAVNQKALDNFPYRITATSADKLLMHRIREKNAELTRLVGDKSTEPLLEWLATDLHYQGRLTGKRQVMIKENKIIKNNKERTGYLTIPQLNKEGDPNLRQLGRRIVADYYEMIKQTHPFSANMTEEERKNHAEQLHRYVAGHAGEILGGYNSKHTNIPNGKIFMREIASIGAIQIERDRLGRDLTPAEIQQACEKSKQLCESYYLTGSTPNRVAKAKEMADDAKKQLNQQKIASAKPNATQTLRSAGKNITQAVATKQPTHEKTTQRS